MTFSLLTHLARKTAVDLHANKNSIKIRSEWRNDRTQTSLYLSNLINSHWSSGVICCDEGQSWKLGIEHCELMADFRARCNSCSMTNSFVPNAVLIETTALWCCHLHQLLSPTTQYLDSRQSVLLQSELKWNCWKSGRGARAPVPHSWLHWSQWTHMGPWQLSK